MTSADTRFDDLTERQQRACHVIAKKYHLDMADIPPNFDALVRLLQGDCTVAQAERETGLLIIDRTHPSLF